MPMYLQNIPNDIKCVYFIMSSDYVKIGIASQLRTRYKAIKTDCPHSAILLGWVADDEHRKLEEKLHKDFKEVHYRGEWFYATRHLIDRISKLDNYTGWELEKYKPPFNPYEELCELLKHEKSLQLSGVFT